MLVGSGCLLLRESGAEIYGTYSVFDHLGSYSEPSRTNAHTKNVTIIQKKGTPVSKTLMVTSSTPHPHEVRHTQQQPHPPIQSSMPYHAASPLPAPQYEDSIARPFSDVHESAAASPAALTSSTTGVSTQQLQQQSQETALQTTTSTTSPPPAAGPSQARVPLYVYNPGLARRLGLGTFMMGSVLYGLTLLPALLAVGATTGVGPFAGQSRSHMSFIHAFYRDAKSCLRPNRNYESSD